MIDVSQRCRCPLPDRRHLVLPNLSAEVCGTCKRLIQTVSLRAGETLDPFPLASPEVHASPSKPRTRPHVSPQIGADGFREEPA